MAERYSLKVIWDDLALPKLACSFKLAIGPTKMLLAFCGVLVVCTLGYLMDRCSNTVVTTEEIFRHVEPAKFYMLSAVVEHICEATVGPEHLGVRTGKLRNKVEHEVAFRGAQARETHASECT